VTGANRGIGRAIAVAMAKRGMRLTLAGRSEPRHREVLEEVRALGSEAEWVPLDLADLDSVRDAASRLLASVRPLDLLVDNAAVGAVKGQTRQGFELNFGVNHLGHFLLTESLLPLLHAAGSSRVVILSSGAHFYARDVDWDALRAPTRGFMGLHAYAVSKLCNAAYARELAERVRDRGISTYAVHPGAVATQLVLSKIPWGLRQLTEPGLLSPAQGALAAIACATSEAPAEESGLYYHRGRPRQASPLARDAEFARRLSALSREWAGLEG
jgi:NAD(P)-dependent dehydrogenase (short-subunit alcohol dehydrogenase family)